MDWSPYAIGGAAKRSDSFTGLNPAFAAAVYNMVQDAHAAGFPLQITSAYRSPEVQAQLYEAALKKYGSPEAARKWVAPPGHSQHNFGNAVDFALGGSLLRDANSPAAKWIAENAAAYNLDVPMDWEPWQVEMKGGRDNPAKRSASKPGPNGVLSAVSTKSTGADMQPTEKAGGIWGALFPNMTQDQVDQVKIGAMGATYRPNIAAIQAAQSRMDQRAQNAQQAQAQERADKEKRAMAGWIAQNFPGEMGQKLSAAVLGGMDMGQALGVIKTLTPQPEAPVKGTEINGQLVNPVTGEVIGDYRDEEKTTTAFQTLDQRARAAGLQPGTPEYMRFMAEGGAQNGMSLSVGPDGSVKFTQGKQEKPQDITNPVSAESMVANIDGILKDPALDWATGFFEWTQGVPGTGSARFGARVKQLNGQAFLRAFESLKGGGHITEIEGQKATEAIGRLDTAQAPEDYRAALQELQGLLKLGIEREKSGGAITTDRPGVSEVDINGSTYRVEKVK